MLLYVAGGSRSESEEVFGFAAAYGGSNRANLMLICNNNTTPVRQLGCIGVVVTMADLRWWQGRGGGGA